MEESFDSFLWKDFTEKRILKENFKSYATHCDTSNQLEVCYVCFWRETEY